MQIAAQLYTVREFTQTEKDFAETIKKVAEIGYPGVQLSAHNQEIPAQFIKDTCNAHKLEIVCTHTPPPKIINETDKVIADHKIFGAPLIGIGSMPPNYRADVAGFKQFISDYMPAALKMKEEGLRFGYHNHAFEFEKFDGKLMFDYLLEGFEEADMQIILDTFWVQAGGADPVYWIKKLAGKIARMHFKDMTIKADERRFTEIGNGNLNWPAIIQACRESKVDWVIVEQDNCYEKDPFVSLKESYEFLVKNV